MENELATIRGICTTCHDFTDGYKKNVAEFICLNCATLEMMEEYEEILKQAMEEYPLPEDELIIGKGGNQ
jgi:hypothetical protein